MDIHQYHYGKKFYQDKKTGYWISTCCPRVRAHVWVWQSNYCKVPKGCQIHHKDHDKSNNDISNLTIMSRSDHLRLHMQCPIRKEKARAAADKCRPLTKEWHRTEEGRAWHKLHAIKNKFGKWSPKEYICQVCEEKFQSTKRSITLFCSNPCKSKFRRDSGVDNANVECEFCKTNFVKNKYSKQRFCSRKCGQAIRKGSILQ